MKIWIRNDQKKIKIDRAAVRKVSGKILKLLGKELSELSILLVDDEKITKMNRDFLGKKGPTNVISFPMGEGEMSHLNPDLLGDIVISLETAKREAEMEGVSLEERVFFLLLHGTLHLIGYDHEVSQKEALRMRKIEALLKGKLS